MPTPPSLQSTVDRYAKSLAVPHGLQQLHGRKKHRPTQPQMTLAPAMVLTSVAAFEGFVEEFNAVVGGIRGLSFAQIVRIAHTNSPSLKDFHDDLLKQLSSWEDLNWKRDFALELFSPPAVGGTNWWGRQSVGWDEAVRQADAWVQVRHSLSHGLTRGYLTEVWPGPMKAGIHASYVLRPYAAGKHSLSLHSAINCARILRYGAEILSTQAAIALSDQPPKWRAVPAFPLDA
ncbi:hypothetical protein ACFQ9V_01650 [Leifsonia sp. NPDC056665]|uniref:hypothetical protein n=1 Tax=Leifsonia sp. NPDC056665 TaxID=3345901 RepID=UPI0036C85571